MLQTTRSREWVFIAAIVMMFTTTGCRDSGTQSQPSEETHPPDTSVDAYERKGILGGKEFVLLRSMIESDTALLLRARQAGVEPSSLNARAYGIKSYVLFEDAEIGHAFMHVRQVYHLGPKMDQLIADDTYYYCTGFLSTDIVKVTETRWSKYYAPNETTIAQFYKLAEAVRSGVGRQDAFEALNSGILGPAGAEQNRSEHEVTWFAGRETIEEVNIELMRSGKVGNRVAVRFVQ